MAPERRVDPEILDNISPFDAKAEASRRDLRRLNALMFNAQTMARLLGWCWQSDRPPRAIVEIGGGDGTFTAAVARRMSARWPSVTVTLVDLKNIVRDATRRRIGECGWKLETIEADALSFLRNGATDRPDLIMANLFLHHLDGLSLSDLLALAAKRAKGIAACEPRRNRFALLSSKLVFAIGANEVTRHDAPASVRAGFRDAELSESFVNSGGWELREYFAPPFTHGFAARLSRAPADV